MKLTREEIEAGRSPKGGWTRAQLAAWGVPWPPPKGWRKRLETGENPTPAPPPKGVREAWWWTIARTGSRCDDCREHIPASTEMAFRSASGERLCPLCVETRGLHPQVSRRWRAFQAKASKR